MPKQTISYNTKEIGELIKRALEARGRKVIGDVKFTITAASSDGPYYSAPSVTADAEYEDSPNEGPFFKRPVDYSSCRVCGGRGAGYCSACGNPGTPGDR